MTERPLLLKQPEVRGILDGRISQIRREWKRRPHGNGSAAIWMDLHQKVDDDGWPVFEPIPGRQQKVKCPYGKTGNLLWCKETWAVGKCADGLKTGELHPGTWLFDNGGCWYIGYCPPHPISPGGKWRSSVHMPKWASRITLKLTGVRFERLRDISEENAVACGGRSHAKGLCTENPDDYYGCWSARTDYRNIWKDMFGPDSWDRNPATWVLEVKRV